MIQDVKREVWGRVRRQRCRKSLVLPEGKVAVTGSLGKLEMWVNCECIGTHKTGLVEGIQG